MQTSTEILAFSSATANRLSLLLPALSTELSRDWTAQVYGYQSWAELVEKLERDSQSQRAQSIGVHAFDITTDWSDYEVLIEFQLQKLTQLLGWSRQAAEHLYVTWGPQSVAPVGDKQLAQLGRGTPAFELLQGNIFGEEEDASNVIAGFSTGLVLLGYPGNAEQRQHAVSSFLSKAHTQLSSEDQAAFAEKLTQDLVLMPQVVPSAHKDGYAQVLPMCFYAYDIVDESNLQGAALVNFELTASQAGAHGVTITLERFAALDGIDLTSAMSEVIAVATWEAVIRYLWCTVGNVDKTAYVTIECRADKPVEVACANQLQELLVSYGGVFSDMSQGTAGFSFVVKKLA